jgi:WD40 repeat protein
MLVNDAILFVKMFSKPITKSALHVYISALSFVPRSSWIYKHYWGISGCTINVLRGALEEWPQYIWQSRGHNNGVQSVAFSPDGKQIVSGSHDCTMCLWDAASGQLIRSPLKGHSNSVTSVAFSPDGKQIVSGSDDHTICLWDAASGQLIRSPLKGHSDWVRSVAFSPDGKQIVAHYYGGPVHSWNLATSKIDPCQDLSTDTKFGFLTVQDGWVHDARDKSLLYWIPEHSWSLHALASSGAKLVMGHSTGRVTIIDATAVFQSQSIWF